MRRTTLLALVGGLVLSLGLGVAVAKDITCDGGRCEGTPRPDRMIGTDGHDRILGLGNRDQISARGGQDGLLGDGGSDDLCGEGGSDEYEGGRRPDFLSEFGDCSRDFTTSGGGEPSGNDHMHGGRGTDFIEGSDGNDRLFGEAGADITGTGAQGGEGYSQLYGDPGDDVLRGGALADGMEGEEGDDEHYGGTGNDHIDAANDESEGGEDFVDCGPGYDRAVANRNDEVRHCERVFRKDNPSGGGGFPFPVSDPVQDAAREAFLSR